MRLLTAIVATLFVAAAQASLEDRVLPQHILNHLQAFEDLANLEHNKGSRAVFLGYNDSADYVISQLSLRTNYEITIQDLTVEVTEYPVDPELTITYPESRQFSLNQDFVGFNRAGSGVVTGNVKLVRGGCYASDFVYFTRGEIALINRSGNLNANQTCSYRDRVANAVTAGAVGALIYNPDDLLPTLGSANAGTPIPVFAISSSVANYFIEFTALNQQPRVTMNSKCNVINYPTFNIIAETKYPQYKDRTIVVGAHLDSVPAGPGINDNGSGSASILEIALQFAQYSANPVNNVRFAWWAAEEWGLLGSQYYVDNLSADERSKIACNLNFDMVGSPNFIRGVYDGRNGPTDVQAGSGKIQGLFEVHFDSKQLTYEPTPFNGRSDYGPFIAVGIPAGGLAAGAEEIKTVEQRDKFGGVAMAALDTCYHRACDGVSNISVDAIEQNSKAAASVLETLSSHPDLKNYLAN